jgi:hypothetical protein
MLTLGHSPRLLGVMIFVALGVRLGAGPWEPLFNGRDLAGWKQLNGTAPYVVADGAIVGTMVADSPNSFLATEKTYGDFIFECEVRQEAGEGNTGVQFRGLSRPEFLNGRVHGYQLDIDPTPRAWTGGIYDEARRGWLYPGTLNPAGQAAYKYGEWNRLRIEAIGPSIRTWVNGVPVAAVMDDLTPAGFIALQIHSVGKSVGAAGSRVHWRGLRIQTTDLKPSPVDPIFVRNVIPNTISEAERVQGWRLLWDGRTAAGWRGAKQAAFPAAGWTMADGVLTLVGTKGGDSIMTEELFGAFEFQCEFHVTPGANSGIKYLVSALVPAPNGVEYQILDDEKHRDAKLGKDGNRTLASAYDLITRGKMPSGLAIVPRVNEWQHARIVATADGRVQHWLNGIKVVDYNRRSPEFAALVAASKYVNIPGFGLADKGAIYLQEHGDRVQYRSLKIRELGP